MNELYETDLLLWSERQAELLRRVAAGERVNDQVDWENVVEEIAGVGRNELREVESLLVQAIAHTLKAEAWPLSHDVAHWRAEARRFRGDAAARFTPAMRQRLDMTRIWRRASRAVPETIDGQGPLTRIPATCPVTLDELLSEE
jgi:hypothetical protein